MDKPSIGTEKKCSKCKQILPIENFHKCSANKDWRKGSCKTCGKEHNQIWRANNLESERKKSRAWFAKNIERAHKSCRAWRAKNLDYDRERCRAWNIANPIRTWGLQTLRRHKKNGFDIKISVSELVEMAQNVVKCPYCETVLDWNVRNKGPGPKPNSPSLDRIYNGKVIDKDSIQILCNRCNVVKGNEFGDVLRRRLLGMLRNIPMSPYKNEF